MRNFKRRQRRSLPFCLFLAVVGALLLPALIVDFGLEAGLSGAQEEVTTDPGARVFQVQGAESSRRYSQCRR